MGVSRSELEKAANPATKAFQKKYSKLCKILYCGENGYDFNKNFFK